MRPFIHNEQSSQLNSIRQAGVVISARPLTEIVPLYKSKKDHDITTQCDMNALEQIGLPKMDFLGLTTLTVLNDAVRLIEQNRGINIEISALPLDDPSTYELFSRGDARNTLWRCGPPHKTGAGPP
jgi:DNA polymerase III subunit alpha